MRDGENIGVVYPMNPSLAWQVLRTVSAPNVPVGERRLRVHIGRIEVERRPFANRLVGLVRHAVNREEIIGGRYCPRYSHAYDHQRSCH